MGKISEEELDEMIEDATVDCYDEYEAFAGILVALQDNLSFPFKAKALGDTVDVMDIDGRSSGHGIGVVAKVEKQGKIYNIRLDELEVEPDSENSKWLQMLHHWNSKY
jgi:hypothetical protein